MQPSEIVVRQAIEADFQKIIASGNGSNPLNPFSSVDRLRQLPSLGLIVAEVNNVYAGFLYWFLMDEKIKDGVSEKNAHIVVVKIEKKYQNTKVGLRLLQKALNDINEEKVNAIFIDTLEANVQLRDLYEKIGFSTVNRTLHMRYIYTPKSNQVKRSDKETRELAVCLVELREQCRAFMTAYTEIMEMISKGPPTDTEGKRSFSAKIWSRVQASLASCSIISKLLWKGTSNKKRLMLSREMRQFLKLPEKNPFPVSVRNAFEHIDERIIDWLPKQRESIPWGWSISAFQEEEEPRDSSQALRYFHIDTLELRVADSSCNLREVMKQVQNIEERIPAEAQIFFEKL